MFKHSFSEFSNEETFSKSEKWPRGGVLNDDMWNFKIVVKLRAQKLFNEPIELFLESEFLRAAQLDQN